MFILGFLEGFIIVGAIELAIIATIAYILNKKTMLWKN